MADKVEIISAIRVTTDNFATVVPINPDAAPDEIAEAVERVTKRHDKRYASYVAMRSQLDEMTGEKG